MKRKLSSQDEEEDDKKAKIENAGAEVKMKEFDVKQFRQKLKKSGNFFDDLKLFINIATKTQDIVFDFINGGGKPLEVVETIKSHEESSLEILSNLYTMLNFIIKAIMNDDNQRPESTVQSLKYLVNKNNKSIMKMLSSSNVADKITMLNILTIAVKIDRELGHDILKNITIFSKVNEKSDLAIFEEEVKSKRKKTVSTVTVRESFVNFFMSFLLRETDAIMCKKILQKHALFEFFLQNLYHDGYETIKDVLSCLTKSVLISTSFSKPEKLKIFTDESIKHLLKLYEWKGSDDEKDNVVNLAHHFLILLLTNRKYGIAFKGITEHRQNLRQLHILGIFKNVWMHEYPSLLTIEMVKSCPDLMQNLLHRLVIGLAPKVTTNWFMCANFTKKLISEIDPSAMMKLIAPLEPKKISNNIIRFSMSQFILQHMSENALIQQDNLEIREISADLLLLMLKQCCKYLSELSKIDTLKDFEKHRIRFDLINHLFTFFPHIDIILNSLYRSIVICKRSQSDRNRALVKSQLKNTLDILLLLIESFPSTIEKIPSVVDYLETLRQVYEYQLSATDETNKNENIEIEMKIVKIILALQPNILSLETEMFTRIFTIMVQVYCCSTNEAYRKESRTLLFKIIKNISLFSSASDLEISIWLEALRIIPQGILEETINTFIKVLKSNQNTVEVNFKWDSGTVSTYDINLFDSINNSERSDDSVVNYSCQLSNALPILLTFKPEKLNRIIEFVEVLILLLYHSFPEMKKSFITLLKRENLELNTKIVNYIKKKSLTTFDDILVGCSSSVYKEFQNSIVNDCEFQGVSSADGESLQLLILQTVFCGLKLSHSDSLTDEKVIELTKYIKCFYNKILELEADHKNKLLLKDDNKPVGKTANKIYDYDMQLISSSLVSYIFEHNSILLNDFNIIEMNQITKLIESLLSVFNTSDNFAQKLEKYCLKIVTQLKNTTITESTLNVIEMFPFGSDQYHDLMTLLMNKPIDEKSIRAIKLCIDKITQLKETPLSTTQIQQLEKIYVNSVLNTTLDLNQFDESLKNYLLTFPHSMEDMSCEIFKIVFQDDVSLTKTFLQLVVLLFSRKNEWNELFIKDAMKVKKEYLYPLLHIAFKKNIVSDNMLKPLYAEFKSGIVRAIEKPNKAAQIYRENVESSIQLIKFAMPQNECRDITTKKFKFESSAIFQAKMLHAIFTKALEAEQNDTVFYNFISLWIQLFGLSDSKDHGDYLDIMTKWIEYVPTTEDERIQVNDENWNKFYKTCLKNGLKSIEHSQMLVILGKVIATINVEPKEIVTIFDMIFSHSNFFKLAFNMKSLTRNWKRNLFYLINVLAQKNPEIAHEKHIPIYLSSYQATMSSCDQLILNLLRFYEIRCGIDLHEYNPLLFGQAALTHFTSHEHNELKFIKNTSLDKMDGVFFKLLSLFEKSLIENTLNNYPIKRQLAGVDIKDMNHLLNNDGDDNIYDPGYFLPLFEMILTGSSFKFLSVAVKNELISLIPPALSCEDENMRLLAAHILLKCRENTEAKKKTKGIWIRYYDSMQKGIADVKEGTQSENKDEKHFPRPASISTRMLAEFSRIIPNKLHPIYNTVSNYLIIKDKFEFSTIPELLVLFHSSEVQHEETRLFILNMINNGINDGLDFKILNNTPFLKMILSCYKCPLSSRKIDLLILKIVDKLVIKCDKTQYLIDKYGLGLWIFQTSVNVEAFEYDIIEVIVSLIYHVFHSSKENEHMLKILRESTLTLLKKFTKTKLSINSFLHVLKVINEMKDFKFVSKDDCIIIQEIASVFIPTEFMQQLMYIQNYSKACKYLEATDLYTKSITADQSTIDVIAQVREFMINYYNTNNS
ncbi:nucleolar pre-ribosomal-associated protein 1 isoform X2 [Chironomus tepperi]|uniref:nucleolar pre-ribosomal-associated protein 1 isoform X2 n=1 Tax=Chironomus tepperi TaxID=113505 RepID=UPI00391FA522